VAPCNPTYTGRTPFEISIPADRDSSTKEAEGAKEEIQVFTDGLAIKGKVDAAATLLRAGRPARTLHYHLGPEEEHTVHEAELVGIVLGLHLISTKRKGATTCAIGTDDQAAIKAFVSDLRKPGHHLAREVMHLTYRIRNRRRKSKYKLTIRWTAGHEGIEGNEAADQEAKKAAKGHTSDKEFLPAYLRKPLLMNPLAVKRAHNDALKSKWTNKWKQSNRGLNQQNQQLHPIEEIYKSNQHTRHHTLRGKHNFPTQDLTHPIEQLPKCFKRVDSAKCPACGTDDENITHYLLSCPSC
jgi:ribonuclease HI